MVNQAFNQDIVNLDDYFSIHQSKFNWVSLPIQEIFESDLRLEAGVYATKAEKAKLKIKQNKFGVLKLSDLIDTNHCPRFKRVFVDRSNLPIYQPSQIKELNPLPAAYISDRTATDLGALRVHQGQILMTCSGTVGKVTLVSKTLHTYSFSHDLLRINVTNEQDRGHLYTHFRSEAGRLLIPANNYGAVIKHIEPSHLLKVPIPNAPILLRKLCDEKIKKSFQLRDISNELITQAYSVFKEKLSLLSIDDFLNANKQNNQLGFTVSSKDLNSRFEAKYHHPLVGSIISHLTTNAKLIKKLKDPFFTKSILLPGRYKRYYVEPQYGVPFIGGKEILELDPRGEKYLSLKLHSERIATELTLEKNMILVTRSGTIGKVVLVPDHWDGWTASEHLLRVNPVNDTWAGYIYAWLSSEWALHTVLLFLKLISII